MRPGRLYHITCFQACFRLGELRIEECAVGFKKGATRLETPAWARNGKIRIKTRDKIKLTRSKQCYGITCTQTK